MNDARWLNDDETDTWLALWAVISWLPTRLDEQLKADSGMGHHDYFTLAQISMSDNASVTMTDLAALTQMSPSRLSHVVGRLEKRGFVTRTPDNEDRRINIAAMTDEGWDFIREAAPGHVEHVRELIFDALSKEESHQLGELLRKVITKLEPTTLPRA
ncbi:MarR family winged helix-turn-helix transcriptional regulator [Corynebacterium lubricantis]|uniref:MarR family winged helix-turn-helix transcriptional regulator n=1 Tax=Corynebacterium lubricantis TaxID=541095 RepID=UPI0003601169|nr:MarR family transcriptional regulator [Corynebacterium lubricantis]